MAVTTRIALLRRRRQRGAALFIVVMVIVLLSAIGVFSVRAASLVDATSGHNRQAVQTAYITEFAARSVASELVGKQRLYYDLITVGTDHCRSSAALETLVGSRVPCYAMYTKDIWERVDDAFPNTVGTSSDVDILGDLAAPRAALGNPTLEGSFVVEMTDIGLSGSAIAGTEIGKWKHYQVTFTAMGHVFPATGAGGVCNPSAAAMSSLQSLRAHVTFGPFSE